MKIEGPTPLRPTPTPRRTDRAGASGGGFANILGGADSDAEPVVGGRPVSGVDALLAMQEVDPDAQRRARGRKRAADLLDRLDEVRTALLTGLLPADQLAALRDTLASEREGVDDPALTELLDEIDLRAQVELAKLESGNQI